MFNLHAEIKLSSVKRITKNIADVTDPNLQLSNFINMVIVFLHFFTMVFAHSKCLQRFFPQISP